MSHLAIGRPRPLLTRFLPLGAALWLGASVVGAQPSRYAQTNLTSNIPGLAANTDPDLRNPWGISFGPATPFWLSDNGTGLTTLYNGFGVKQGLIVTIPAPPGSPSGTLSEPTGQVFNGFATTNPTSFLVNGNPARFIFATEGGTVAGWNGGTLASTQVNTPNASYTGLAIGASGTNPFLYAANFASGHIDPIDGNWNLASLGGSFTDPNLPAGYSPFNVQNIGGQLYVAYALMDQNTGDEIQGAGLGIVDVYDTDGNLVRRLINPGGALNAPWGFALAPASFGAFGGSLLVGNLGDGTINAFDPTSGAMRGTLLNLGGTPLVNDGLWGIAFGNAGVGFNPNALYIAAGINDEEDGLFARITATPEPSSVALVATGLGALLVAARRRRRA